MNLTRVLVIAGLLVAGIAIPSFAQQAAAPPQRTEAGAPAFKKLTRAELDALLQKPEGVLILDVRRPDELQSNGGFPVYLSIQAADVEKYLAFIPRDRAIVTVSNRSARAGRAAALLAQRGFNVAGGIGALEYEAEGGTLLKVAAPAARGNAGRGNGGQ
jgi:rhodanese-related sulfurtransferase